MWQDEAACLDADPALFFPPPGRNATAAKKICTECPVRVECLQAAMDWETPADSRDGRAGVYGGLTGKERHRLTRATT